MPEGQRHERFGELPQQVAAAAREVSQRSDRELLATSRSIRHRLSQGEGQASCVPEAFAAVAEAARRSAGITVTDSQLTAAAGLLDRSVVELRDGEGKGMAAILAAYVLGLSGLSVHVVTLDDYLARRDFRRARDVLEFLAIGTGLIGDAHSEVTYGSYTEFISGYLASNLAKTGGDDDWGGQDVAIVDEADTILLDEARRLLQIPANPNAGTADDAEVLAECRVHGYFRAYRKLAGLTATAASAAERFAHFYDMNVVQVPASHPDTRVDHDDLWFIGTSRMLADVEMLAMKRHNRGQPVLIKAESGLDQELSTRLKGRGVPHAVLRPGHSSDTARVMAGAGKLGAVTIISQTVGRGYGVDLGGYARDVASGGAEAERAQVVALGGLIVLGAFQSGSERADDWARGLAGQRGEPGESQFFHSSEEYSIKNPRLVRVETRRNKGPFVCDGSPLGRFYRSIFNDVYRNSEAATFAYQRDMAEFDDLVDRQQRQAYALRRLLLAGIGSDAVGSWAIDICAAYKRRERELSPEGARELSRSAVSAFDSRWPEHLSRLHRIYSEIPRDKGRRAKKLTASLLDEITESFDDAMNRIKDAAIGCILGS